MHSRMLHIGLVLCTIALFGFRTPGSPHGAQLHTKTATFAQVNALLKGKCVKCHNDKRSPEKVNLSSYRAIMHSGSKTPTVVPGHPEKSNIVAYIDGTKMPRMPMGGKPLSVTEIMLVRSWIKNGAKE